jgi:hypothetical protein
MDKFPCENVSFGTKGVTMYLQRPEEGTSVDIECKHDTSNCF